MTATYTPGEWYAVVDGPTIALLDPAVEADLVRAVWGAVVGGSGVPGVIRALTSAYGGDFAAIPAFAVVAPQRGGLLLAVRGPGRVRVRTAGGEVDASGLEVTTWSERWVAEPLAVEVLAPAGGVAPGLPLRSGVVPAARVALTLDDGAAPRWEAAAPAAVAPPAPSPFPAPVPGPGPVADPVGASAPVAEPVAEPVAASDTGAGPVAAPETVGEETITEPDAEEPAARAPGVGSTAPYPTEGPPPAHPAEHVGAPDAPDAPDASSEANADPHGGAGGRVEETRVAAPDDGGYDHLWEGTVLRSVEDAARRGGAGSHEDRGTAPWYLPVPPAGGAEAAPGPGVEPAPGPMIADVPGMADAYPDDHDGQTIFRPRRPASWAEQPAQVAAPTPAGGPSVLARVCDQGHPNPPQAGQCRVCGQPLGADAVRVPRPALGRARLSSGEVVVLDTPAVLGRSPKTGRVAGPDVPRPVTVPSPTREVSGTHLAIRLEEWHVLVADLGSANGTILRRPGQPPQRLHPREPALVFSGDVVDLGDGVTVTFEDLP